MRKPWLRTLSPPLIREEMASSASPRSRRRSASLPPMERRPAHQAAAPRPAQRRALSLKPSTPWTPTRTVSCPRMSWAQDYSPWLKILPPSLRRRRTTTITITTAALQTPQMCRAPAPVRARLRRLRAPPQPLRAAIRPPSASGKRRLPARQRRASLLAILGAATGGKSGVEPRSRPEMVRSVLS